MSLISATQLTAVATAVLALVTAFYVRQAFRKQSQEVRDHASLLELQSEQRKINELQAEDLRESLKERARQREVAER